MSDQYLDSRQRFKPRQPQDYEAIRHSPGKSYHSQGNHDDGAVHRGSSKRSGRKDRRGQQPEGVMSAEAMCGITAATALAPTTGQFRSGHIEVDSLYAAGSQSATSNLVVNAMNAPNNSTMQCGCENIDCPFCNLMTSVQMKESY